MAEYVVFKRGAKVPERSVDREAMLERVDLILDKGEWSVKGESCGCISSHGHS